MALNSQLEDTLKEVFLSQTDAPLSAEDLLSNEAAIMSVPDGKTHLQLITEVVDKVARDFKAPTDQKGEVISIFVVAGSQILKGCNSIDDLLKLTEEQKEASNELFADLQLRGSGFESMNLFAGGDVESFALASDYLDVVELRDKGKFVLGPVASLIAKAFTADDVYNGAMPLASDKEAGGRMVMSDRVAELLIPILIGNMVLYPLYWKVRDRNLCNMVSTGLSTNKDKISPNDFKAALVKAVKRNVKTLTDIGNDQGRSIRAYIALFATENIGEDPCNFGQNSDLVRLTRLQFAGYKLLNQYFAKLQSPSLYAKAMLTPRQISELLIAIQDALQAYRIMFPLAYIASSNMQNIPPEFSSIVESVIADSLNEDKSAASTARRTIVRVYRGIEYANLQISGPGNWKPFSTKLR